MTSKFNKRHKPIQPAIRAAKTRRAIKVVIKRSHVPPADGGRSEGGRREEGSLAHTMVSQKVRRAGTH